MFWEAFEFVLIRYWVTYDLFTILSPIPFPEAPVDESTNGEDGGGGDEAPASEDKGEEITAEGA